jgi:hypothetical protein
MDLARRLKAAATFDRAAEGTVRDQASLSLHSALLMHMLYSRLGWAWMPRISVSTEAINASPAASCHAAWPDWPWDPEGQLQAGLAAAKANLTIARLSARLYLSQL